MREGGGAYEGVSISRGTSVGAINASLGSLADLPAHRQAPTRTLTKTLSPLPPGSLERQPPRIWRDELVDGVGPPGTLGVGPDGRWIFEQRC
jgi:hypothetical protein